jgi:hypothetical protein
MTEREPYIAGWNKPSDWHRFKIRLLGEPSPALWQHAFDDYFMQRLNLRYIKPIRILQDNGTFQGEGFSIMAILCTLVEFLESTFRGLRYRFARRRSLQPFEYNTSRDVFVDFLSTRVPFRDYFDKNLALEFYTNVRCCLLHEAHIKGGWTIHAKSHGEAIVERDTRTVYRDNFRDAFNICIADYGKKLLVERELQEAFVRKFDFICKET